MFRLSTCPVGMFPAGAVNGVYDLAGNVEEWNADWYADYASSGMGCWNGGAQFDPVCNTRAVGRVLRGGSWGFTNAAYFRAASRYFFAPIARRGDLGFRCARD